MKDEQHTAGGARRPWGSGFACFMLLLLPALSLTVAHWSIWSDYTVSVKWFAHRMPAWLAWYSYVVAMSIPVVALLALAVPVAVLTVPVLRRLPARALCIAACAALHVMLFLGHWSIIHRMTGCTFGAALHFWGIAPFLIGHFLMHWIRST